MKRHVLGRLRAPFMPHFHKKQKQQDFPGGPVVKNLPANAGTWVWSPDWENTTCCRAAKPVCHSYWACTPELTIHNMRSSHNEKLTLQLESSPGSLQLEKTCMQQQRPITAKTTTTTKPHDNSGSLHRTNREATQSQKRTFLASNQFLRSEDTEDWYLCFGIKTDSTALSF